MPRPRSSEGGEEGAEEAIVMEAVVRSRCGSVLSRASILKLYHFPGLKTHQQPHSAHLAAVPNFFQVCMWLARLWPFTQCSRTHTGASLFGVG